MLGAIAYGIILWAFIWLVNAMYNDSENSY